MDEGSALPVLRIEDRPGTGDVAIVLPSSLLPDDESPVLSRTEALVALAPPYWPHGETRPITVRDVAAARTHVGTRAAFRH